jgi:hypothetical protein
MCPSWRARDGVAATREGGSVGSDYSALFYVLVAIVLGLVAKFSIAGCGCS